jgi:hypothetical protein
MARPCAAGSGVESCHARVEGRPAVNDAQTWTLIAGFFALMVSMTGLTLRAVRAEISVLGVRIDGLERRIDHLDRDVQMVLTRFMES